MIKEKTIKRRNGPYHLTSSTTTEAWFYTNADSIDLVLNAPDQGSILYKLKVSDMKRIVVALGKKP